MFEAKLEDAQTLKKCVKTLNTLINEGQFQVNDQGINLKAMDPSQIAMVNFELPKSSFSDFDASEETTIGLNLDDLNDRTKRSRSEDSIEMSLANSGSRLKMVFKGKVEREFDQPLLDLSGSNATEPSIDYGTEIKINGGNLKENLKDANLISSHVVFKATPEEFVIEAEGDKGNVNISIGKDDDVILDYKVDKEERAMFPIEYLNDLLTGANSSSIVTLNLKADKPLKLRYGIDDATFTYYLAPRVEE